ncbi:MAG: PAS domain S-box protein [Acidobacteria bacterium]|nr:PAS domain S-box protein [Acidobacteriota bacterium]MBI3662795.1 PAS domain S-box protein [Acidobacteriota bacterium]
MFSISLEGEIRAVNRRFAELAELPFSDIVGHNLESIIEEPTRETAERSLPRFLERRFWQGILRVRLRKTGGMRYFDCTLRGVVKDGEVVGVSGLARDVTYERESEARFTQLFETLHEGVYFSTPEGRLLDANPALVTMLGYENKDELLQVNVTELYTNAEDRPNLLQELEEQRTVREREIVLRRKDGRPVICLDTSTAIRDTAGRVLRYQGTLVDITQRREMEERLHQEQEFARRLVESFPDMIVVLDREGRYTYISARMKDQLGYEPEEILGRSLGERTHADDQSALLEMHREMIQGKRTYGTVEYRTLHMDGSWRTVRATARPLCDACGNIVGVIASARDMTELKRLEQQVSQSERLAAMGQMIAGVAHELNNPLTAILGINDLLREKAADDATRRQLDLTQKQARRAAEIVQNLLTFSRPRAPRRGQIRLDDLVLHTIQLHEYSLHVNNVHVDYHAGPELPPVFGDSNQLMQVFLNLIVNAEQAIREVRSYGKLSVRVAQEGDKVQVAFQDDGPGIPPLILSRIFDPFFTTKRPGRGTGLGLSICMAIMREHGGNIEARTLAEGGALFTLTFPAANGGVNGNSGEQSPGNVASIAPKSDPSPQG